MSETSVNESSKESASEIHSISLKQSKHKMRAPLLIAICIFVITVLTFCTWKCFFDTRLNGDWAFVAKGEKVNYTYSLNFGENNKVRYTEGGITFIGTYTILEDKPQIHIFCTQFGQTCIDAYFDYEFSGNLFTGRKLLLTDRTGLIFPATEKKDKYEENEQKLIDAEKKNADEISEDNVTYYKLSFEQKSAETKIKKYDDFKEDKNLIGSWLYKDSEKGISYTLTFNSDGSMQELSSEFENTFAYKLQDGKIVYRIVGVTGKAVDQSPLEYSIKDNKLTIGGNTLTKTDSKEAYQTEIN